MRDLADSVLKPSEFAVLAQACKDDPQFPRTYDDWWALIDAAERQVRRLGLFPPPLLLVPVAFLEWCQSVEVVPCIDALRAYAIVKRGRVSGLLDDIDGHELASPSFSSDKPRSLGRGGKNTARPVQQRSRRYTRGAGPAQLA